jgi:AcrR family transcriptional regulator
LAATERLLAERPLHELSVTDIAEEAGASRGIFYFYFASKSSVLAALAETVCQELIEIWRLWFDGHGGADEAELRTNLEASVRLWTQHRSILTATVESWRLDPEVSAVWGTMMNSLVDQACARIERDRALGHTMGQGDPAALSEMLIWSTERIHYVALAGISPSLTDPERMVDALVQLWTQILAVPAMR